MLCLCLSVVCLFVLECFRSGSEHSMLYLDGGWMGLDIYLGLLVVITESESDTVGRRK